MQIRPKSSFISVPWKNGGGVTHEAMREPPGADAYRWRVSVADIDMPGPFSSFVGYQRIMALLTGSGVRLSFADGLPCELRAAGDFVEFDGATATQCELLAGPCTDLNLIVTNTIRKPAVSIESISTPHRAVCMRGQTMLAFAIRGSCRLSGSGGAAALDQWSLAVLVSGEEITFTPVMGADNLAPLLFFASLDDNHSATTR